MPKHRTLTKERAKSEIELAQQRKAKLAGLIEEQEMWLRECVGGITSTEEEQHIVGDISEMQRTIVAIDERIRQLSKLLDEPI